MWFAYFVSAGQKNHVTCKGLCGHDSDGTELTILAEKVTTKAMDRSTTKKKM